MKKRGASRRPARSPMIPIVLDRPSIAAGYGYHSEQESKEVRMRRHEIAERARRISDIGPSAETLARAMAALNAAAPTGQDMRDTVDQIAETDLIGPPRT